MQAPLFRPMTAGGDEANFVRSNQSDADTAWISLVCPEQELWMVARRGRMPAAMAGMDAVGLPSKPAE